MPPDTRYCIAGQNPAGRWFIACRIPGKGTAEMLFSMGFTLNTSDSDITYDAAARHVAAHGGVFWTTNAAGEYVTIAGIPGADRARPQQGA